MEGEKKRKKNIPKIEVVVKSASAFEKSKKKN